jgi:hypothetical protein
MQRLGPMSHTGNVKWTLLNERAQSRLKPAGTLVAKMWEVHITLYRVLYLW